MTKVINLFGGGATNEPNADIISALEELLARAQRGEIRAIAWTRMATRAPVTLSGSLCAS